MIRPASKTVLPLWLVLLVSLLISLLAASLAAAGTRTLRGSLDASDPTFTRAYGDRCNSLSFSGANVYYDVHHLTVTAPGTYSFAIVEGTVFDTYFFLYRDRFTAHNPQPCYALNDDFNGVWSYLEAELVPGADYYFVITTFFSGDHGTYTVEVNGPGDILLPDVDTAPVWDPGDARLNPDPAAEVAVYCAADGIELWGVAGAYFGFVSYDDINAAPPDDSTPLFTSADGAVSVFHLRDGWWAVQKAQQRGDTHEIYRFAWNGCMPTATRTEVYDAAGNLLVYETGP